MTELPQHGPSLTSKLLGRVVQVSSRRLHHAPVVHQPAGPSRDRASETTRQQRSLSKRSAFPRTHSTKRADAHWHRPQKDSIKTCASCPLPLCIYIYINIWLDDTQLLQPVMGACPKGIAPCSPPPSRFCCLCFSYSPLGHTAGTNGSGIRSTMMLGARAFAQ